MITLKTKNEIEILKKAGYWAGRLLYELGQLIRPSLDISELDAYADGFIKQHNLQTVFKGYKPSFSSRPYPSHICVSINEELVHGIPKKGRILKEGDIVSIDVGVRYQGYVGDTAATFPVGKISSDAQKLIDVTREALYRAIKSARAGNRLGDIGHAIESFVEKENGFRVIRTYVGHGVGRDMHEDPAVPNYGKPGKGMRLMPGLVIAIEPMVVLGSPDTFVASDGWTVITRDRKLCAHFEHTIAILEKTTIILTEYPR